MLVYFDLHRQWLPSILNFCVTFADTYKKIYHMTITRWDDTYDKSIKNLIQLTAYILETFLYSDNLVLSE